MTDYSLVAGHSLLTCHTVILTGRAPASNKASTPSAPISKKPETPSVASSQGLGSGSPKPDGQSLEPASALRRLRSPMPKRTGRVPRVKAFGVLTLSGTLLRIMRAAQASVSWVQTSSRCTTCLARMHHLERWAKENERIEIGTGRVLRHITCLRGVCRTIAFFWSSVQMGFNACT